VTDLQEHALDPEDLETWTALATLLEWLPVALDANLQRAAGLTHFEYGVLYALATAPDETLRMSVLAGYARSSLTRLSRAVTRLEGRGWVRRSPDPTDGRFTLATLTAAGATVATEASPAHVDLVRRVVLDPLTRGQARALGEAGRRIAAAISAEDERAGGEPGLS